MLRSSRTLSQARSRWGGAGVVASVVLLAGCAATRAPLPVFPCGSEPDSVLACVQAREDGVRSLRARFTATTSRQGEITSSTGVLLVSKPDRFRLRLMLPFGLTVFDCVRNGTDDMQISLPLQGGATSASEKRGGLPFAQIDLDEAFLRGAYTFPGRCEAQPDGGTDVLARCVAADGSLLRQLHLDSANATITEETSFADGVPRFTLRYSDFRPTPPTATVLPYRISLGYPIQGVSLDIDIERYEVNPTLSPELFRRADP